MKPNKEDLDLFADIIREWRDTNKRPEPNMVKCYANDRKSLRHVLSLLRRGKILEASLEAGHLDTILRDLIPDKIWRIMCAAQTNERNKSDRTTVPPSRP